MSASKSAAIRMGKIAVLLVAEMDWRVTAVGSAYNDYNPGVGARN